MKTALEHIAEAMESHLCSIAGDVPDADVAEMHLETWLHDTYRTVPAVSQMTLKESRAFIAQVVGRVF